MSTVERTLPRTALLIALACLLLGAFAGPLAAQSCESCANKGYRDCRDCAKHMQVISELSAAGMRHTHYMRCEKCAGTGFIDCDQCTWFETNGAEWKEWKRRADGNRGWIAEMQKTIDQRMERPCMVGETAHFRMVWDLEKLKVEKRMLDQPALLTLYLKRMESLFVDYLATFQIDAGMVAPKTLVMVWSSSLDQRLAGRLWVEITSDSGCKFYGPNPVYTVLGGTPKLRTDEQIHRNLVHNVSQLLLSSQKPAEWVGQLKGGWVDEGVAHWFEHKYWKICDNYCYVEVDTMAEFKGGQWEPAVRELVVKPQKLVPLLAVITKNTAQLEAQEHAQAFSYCDFLIRRDPKRFVDMVSRLKRKEGSREAIQAAYGLNLFQMEEEWKKWVLETYAAR